MKIEFPAVNGRKPGAGRARKLVRAEQAKIASFYLAASRVNLEKYEETRKAEEARIAEERAKSQWKVSEIRGSHSFSGSLYGFKPVVGGNLTWAEAQAECDRLAAKNAKKIEFDTQFFQECLNF